MKYKRNKDKDFWQMARAYLHDFMPAVRNQSDKSVAAYKQSLNSYLSFLENTKGLKEDQVTFEAFSRSNVKDFVEWLHEKKYASKTINLKLTAIRSFLKYCADEDFELRGIYNEGQRRKEADGIPAAGCNKSNTGSIRYQDGKAPP